MKTYDFQEINQRIINLLRPMQSPIVAKFLKEEKDAAPYEGVRWYPDRSSVCTLFSMPAYFDGIFGMKRCNFSGYCGACNGLSPQDEDWHNGKTLSSGVTRWHRSSEDAKAHMKAIAIDAPEDTLYGMLTATLKGGYIKDPDVVSLALLPAAAFHLLAGLVEKDYEMIHFPFRGESTCADTWNYTYRTGKPGLSLGCRGDRSAGGLHANEVRITLTIEDLVKALEGVEAIEEGGIHYPYYPMGDTLNF